MRTHARLLYDSFDFFNAVVFPIVVLVSGVGMFHVDREQLALNMELFPAGRFERLAQSVLANPTQEELIFRCVNWLRIISPLDFVTKVGFNLLLCYRVSRLIDLIRHAKYKDGRLYPLRHPIALPFMFYALLTLISVIVSVNSSRQACDPHDECVVHARRWVTLTNGELNKCPCLALVDMDTAPKSYDEWLAPRNVSEKVGFLGATGDLEMVYLANRKLETLPENLKSCKRLRSL